jgi:hypothetical protein
LIDLQVWQQQSHVIPQREEVGESLAAVVVPEWSYDVWALQQAKWEQYAARIRSGQDFKFKVCNEESSVCYFWIFSFILLFFLSSSSSSSSTTTTTTSTSTSSSSTTTTTTSSSSSVIVYFDFMFSCYFSFN